METAKLNMKTSIDDLWNQMMLGVVPDKEIRRLMKIELKKRLDWGYRPTHQQQLSQLLDFAKALRCMKMSVEFDTLDSKVYETPKSFQQIMCGTTIKESSGLFMNESTTLDQAQISMLDLYFDKAKIKDGQSILDLGCGHGALILYLAQKYQNCNITGVTNSLSQKQFIVEKCKKLGLSNVEILLADVTKLEMEDTFDRVFVIGLIEHMKNFELFLRKISEWMKPDGLLFLEHYCHKSFAHQWEPIDEEDWFSKYIFPPGTVIIPSASFLLYFQEDVTVIDHWTLSGNHFARTQEEWLKGIDGHIDEVEKTFESFYGISKEEAVKLINFWRVFCLSGVEMFGYNNGEEWMISHLLFKKK